MAEPVAYQQWNYGEKPEHTHGYLLPKVLELIGPITPGLRILDVGCGNGSMAGELLKRGAHVVGIDLSTDGIAQARKQHPAGRFEQLAADDNVLANLNEEPFDRVVSTEVVEHLFAPRAYAAGCVTALKPGGRLVCSTPYHGYLKNLAIAVAGKWDSHANPLWDGGHIKLWSRRTLGELLREAGLTNIQFRGAGRWPGLWMSMVVSGDKPG